MSPDELATSLAQVEQALAAGDATLAVAASRAAMAVCEYLQHGPVPLDGPTLSRAKALHASCVGLATQLQQQINQQAQGLAQSQRVHNAYARTAGGDD